jgi:hypothetical protein
MDLGKPYDGTKSGSLNLNPKFQDTDFIALSLGGNDFALRRETDVSVIIKLVKEVIQFYKSKGVKPQHIIYITPYPPSMRMKAAAMVGLWTNLNSLYADCVKQAHEACAQENIHIMDLSSFGSDEKADPGTMIPEPTPYGAWKLAKMIQVIVLE